MKKKLAMKICAVAMSLAMVGSLAGCGNGDSGNASGSGSDSNQSSTPSQESTGGQESTPDESSETPDDSQPEETKDLGGKKIRVSGGIWGDLNPDNEGKPEYDVAWDLAHQLEAKYNITLEYVKLEGDDGRNTADLILTSMNNGECFADLFTVGDDVMVKLKDGLAEVPDVNALEMGKIYIEPATWGGHTYGFTYDNMGSCYVMAYSKAYLDNQGIDVTPFDKFMAGEWSFEDCKEYMAANPLPQGTYWIAIEPTHWVSMAPAANGAVSVDSNGGIHLTDENYVEALEQYVELMELGLAAPITGYTVVDGALQEDEENASMPYGKDGMCTATESKGYVITMVEAWQMESMEQDLSGEWGIVPWPWGSNVTCDGIGEDGYPILSDNYYVAQSIWTNMVVPKERSAEAKEISDMDMFMIGRDWCDLKSENGKNVRHAAWEAEQKGEEYVNMGYTPGTLGSFCDKKYSALYDWLHSKVVVDWGHAMNQNAVVRVNRNGYFVIAAGQDARSSGESFKQQGEAEMEKYK